MQHRAAARVRGIGAGLALGWLGLCSAGASAQTHGVPYFPAASDAVRQGFVRVVNRSDETGTVSITAIDDAGGRSDPVELSIGGGEAVHFNSDDLEGGNPAKGLPRGVGQGVGDWRLELDSELDLEVLAYLRTSDGFLTTMHDVVPRDGERHRIPVFNPGGNRNQVSLLRLTNPGDGAATVRIVGVDDAGAGGEVETSVPAGASATLTAQELERQGLGDGAGKWQLLVESDRPIRAMSLLRSPTGHLTNLSTSPANVDAGDDAGVLHRVPLMPAAGGNVQGFVRVINHGREAGTVAIRAFDDLGVRRGTLRLELDGRQTAHFNSDDLTGGNAAKGLTGSVAAGTGDWRLELESDLAIEVLVYARTRDGFLTSLHDVAPAAGRDHHVAVFNPGRNRNQVSSLRLVNPGGTAAEVAIVAVDDAGETPGGETSTVVPAGGAVTYTVQELEDGSGAGLVGSIGAGAGKWRLRVTSDQAVQVLSLLTSPTGHLTNLSTSPTPLGTAVAVPVGGLIEKRANRFDLEGATVTFTPVDGGGYEISVGGLDWHEPGTAADGAVVGQLYGSSARLAVDLPFGFPFAGRTWSRAYANANGNMSFHRPEAMNWPHRDPWADAGMRSMAAAVDSRSAAGLEAMVAVLWALYDRATVTVESTQGMTVITWRATRRTAANIYYEPRGENLFQARLHPSGSVDLAYRAAPEQDGIVGLFHGGRGPGRIMDSTDDLGGDVSHGVLDITQATLMDNGSTMLVAISLAEEVPERVERSATNYAVHLTFGDTRCQAGVSVRADGRQPFAWWCGPQPSVVGWRVGGRTVEIPISKTLLNGAGSLSWQAAAWRDQEYDDTGRRVVQIAKPDYDLGALQAAVTGNVYEVFHYPTLPKHRIDTVLSHVYGRVPAADEIAVVFTDFRIDDLFNSGGGTGPVNQPVRGIGSWQADPTPGGRYGSDRLLTSMMPTFVGAPNFLETGSGRGRAFRNHSAAIRWIAHEAVHRWAAHLSFRSPVSGRIEELLDDYCRCHWSDHLHAPAAHPVWPGYSRAQYTEASVMGGNVWVDNGDGTFTARGNSYPLATGLSALDLYVMGLIPANQVPDTFVLRDVRQVDWNRVRATKVPVRIEDIVSVMGPRLPGANASLKEFRLGVYLLHEDHRRPRADLLHRAKGVSDAVADYFARATAGRMRVVPSAGAR